MQHGALVWFLGFKIVKYHLPHMAVTSAEWIDCKVLLSHLPYFHLNEYWCPCTTGWRCSLHWRTSWFTLNTDCLRFALLWLDKKEQGVEAGQRVWILALSLVVTWACRPLYLRGAEAQRLPEVPLCGFTQAKAWLCGLLKCSIWYPAHGIGL